MEDFTRRHLRSVTHNYQHASLCVQASKHLRDLRSLSDSALGAKRTYHTLLSTHLWAQIHIARTHHRWQQHTSTTMEAYYAAKHTTLTLYMESATIVGLSKR